MTAAGLVAVDLACLLLLAWVLNLVRLGRLYVGYGALFVGLLAMSAAVVSVPPLERAVSEGLRIFFPSGGVTVLGFAFVVLLLIYILTQMTILSNRLSAVVQDLAIDRARNGRPGEVGGKDTRPGSGRESK
jgi:hypothetical protein